MWKKVIANSNLIKHETPRAYLIKIPKEKHRFWFPKNCVHFKGKNDYLMTLSYTDDFEIRFTDNYSMDLEDWVECFGGELENPIYTPPTLNLEDISGDIDETLID